MSGVERFNCTLRQRCSRLVRKTLVVFPESSKNHIGAVKIIGKCGKPDQHYFWNTTKFFIGKPCNKEAPHALTCGGNEQQYVCLRQEAKPQSTTTATCAPVWLLNIIF